MISFAAQAELRAAALSKGKEAVLEYVKSLLDAKEEPKPNMRFLGDK